jgi:hypothetical protein
MMLGRSADPLLPTWADGAAHTVGENAASAAAPTIPSNASLTPVSLKDPRCIIV